MFAARSSRTEDVYKIYAERFLGEDHLKRVAEEVRAMVNRALGGQHGQQKQQYETFHGGGA
jgi:phosphoglucomutase